MTNNLAAASVCTHVCQMPIGINDQGGHGGDWRRLVDGDTLFVQVHPVCVLSAQKPKAMTKQNKGGQQKGPRSSMKGALDWSLYKRVADQQGKDRTYWIDEIAFLEARLNGSQGDIDREDQAACEEALKAAKANLAACQ